MAATALAPSKSKPSQAAVPSTAALSSTCATTSLTPSHGNRAASRVTRIHLTKSTISATPSAVPSTSPTTTMPTRKRPSSSFLRNGAERKIQMRSNKTFLPLPNAAGIFRTCVPAQTVLTFPIPQQCRLAQLVKPSSRSFRFPTPPTPASLPSPRPSRFPPLGAKNWSASTTTSTTSIA
jgi:hypothetical protein